MGTGLFSFVLFWFIHGTRLLPPKLGLILSTSCCLKTIAGGSPNPEVIGDEDVIRNQKRTGRSFRLPGGILSENLGFGIQESRILPEVAESGKLLLGDGGRSANHTSGGVLGRRRPKTPPCDVVRL